MTPTNTPDMAAPEYITLDELRQIQDEYNDFQNPTHRIIQRLAMQITSELDRRAEILRTYKLDQKRTERKLQRLREQAIGARS